MVISAWCKTSNFFIFFLFFAIFMIKLVNIRKKIISSIYHIKNYVKYMLHVLKNCGKKC